MTSEEKHRPIGPPLLRHIAFHLLYALFEEKAYQKLISTLRSHLSQCRNIFLPVLLADYQLGQPKVEEDKIRKQSPRPSVAISEGMKIFVKSMKA